MIIKGAKVLTEQFQTQIADVRFQDTILEIGNISPTAGEKVIDASGKFLIPGLVDIHTHGAIGYDANDPSCDWKKWRNYLLANGITTFLPTTVTATPKEIDAALARLEESDGINLEGPFLSAEKKGAHAEEKITEVDVKLLEKHKNQIKITTIAPEVGNNLEKIHTVTQLGIKVSLGHSAADYNTCRKAFCAGATHVTHIFNAMQPLHHREPGLVGAALENSAVFCEVISDGFHLHPCIVRTLYQALGADRMVLISDAISATGLEDGEYTLGGLAVTVQNRQARLADGTIAGSTSHLMMMLTNAIAFGIPIEDAVKMATLTPARAVGMDLDRGSIRVGKRADLVLLNTDFTIANVFLLGTQMDI